MARTPGQVRDTIVSVMKGKGEMTTGEIQAAVEKQLGGVSSSSVRSSLRLHAERGETFERTGHGRYRLKR